MSTLELILFAGFKSICGILKSMGTKNIDEQIEQFKIGEKIFLNNFANLQKKYQKKQKTNY